MDETAGLLGSYGADPHRIQLDLGLSRGLQYYTGMVFEIDHAGLGTESQLCGGGRYDDLIRGLGGRQAVPALGFAFGAERLLLALEAEGQTPAESEPAAVYVVPAATAQAAYAAQVAQAIRRAGTPAQLDVAGRPLHAALAFADREGFAAVAVVGADEARDRTFRLRDMATRSERAIALTPEGRLAESIDVGRNARGD